MKSLNTKLVEGCGFNSRFFTKEAVEHLLNEGFEWRDNNDSYTSQEEFVNYSDRDITGCYKKYEDGNGVDIFIYVCENGIEVDKDYDCGGNMSTNFIEFDNSYEEGLEAFEIAYDEMVDYVNKLKS